MLWFILFCLGLALGSFLHVVASRYDPDRFVFSAAVLGGRSHCPHCGRVLAWYELVPLVSFLLQRGRCRTCGERIGWSYFFVELLSGIIVAFAPMQFLGSFVPHALALAILWSAALLILLLLSLIDLRLQLIPDELTAGVGIIGVAVAALSVFPFWLERLEAGLAAAAFFVLLIYVSRFVWKREGMGPGDAKLAFVLGFLFGPLPTLLLIALAFILGAIAGVAAIARGAKDLKSTIAFGPFLAAAAALVFFFGPIALQSWYNVMI